MSDESKRAEMLNDIQELKDRVRELEHFVDRLARLLDPPASNLQSTTRSPINKYER